MTGSWWRDCSRYSRRRSKLIQAEAQGRLAALGPRFPELLDDLADLLIGVDCGAG